MSSFPHRNQPTGPFLSGATVEGSGHITVRNPFDGSVVGKVATADAALVTRAIDEAAGALPVLSPSERAAVLNRAATAIEDDPEPVARTICLEAGKPIVQARGEVARCIETLRFSAAEALTLTGQMVPIDASRFGQGKIGMLVREPIGVVGAICPFNFPLNLVAHKVAPAIAAGCPVVVKPASQTPFSALLLARILTDAGLTPGGIAVLPGPASQVAEPLVDDPRVPMISFTGSGPVGWGIAKRQPGKRISLELGNSSPVIVAADADISQAARALAASGFTHAGQSCVSVQRVYVHRDIHARFLDEFVTRVEALRTGDPGMDDTDVGPVIDESNQDRIMRWLSEAVEAGGTIVSGGTQDARIITPTIVDGITPDMTITCEEVFGPVVGVAAVDSIDEAIDLANATPYGLQAAVFTQHIDHAIAWASRLDFGGVLINETPTFRVDQQPYGGVKESGNTREGPHWATRSMTQEKLIVIPVTES